ncbi:hypothetical protein CVT24_003924 [Panaeolus cyanescens]|uniref:Uncharacterized protein n=1 Tax=Panaeolus cyanescens TaxID=181874 RepID=A0A409YXF6_9AGAR|nr:hypothetical protein CVT24_003924 [Panaeolus cyanescens]
MTPTTGTITVITPNENTKAIVLVPADPNEPVDNYLDDIDPEEESQEEAAAIERDPVGRPLSDFEPIDDTEGEIGPAVNTLPVVPKLDLYDFQVYRPNNTGRVWSGLEQIYSAPIQDLYGRVTRHLESITWVQITSWNNLMPTDQVFEVSFTTSLRFTQGSEVNRGFNMGATYKGLSIGVNGSRRNFTESETTTSRTVTLRINVPANTLMVFYQRRYDFRDETNFRHYRARQNWAVGVWNAYHPLETKISRVQIMSEEYFTATRFLPHGPGTVNVTLAPQVALPRDTLRRNDTMPRARRNIAAMGI